MKNWLLAFLAWVLVAASPQVAWAQTVHIQVERHFQTGGPCNGTDEINANYSAASPINLSLSTCARYVRITAGASVDMPRITITGGITTLPLEVSLGAFVDHSGADPTSVGDDWGGLDCSGRLLGCLSNHGLL